MSTNDRGLTVTRLKTKSIFTTADGTATFPLFDTKVQKTEAVWAPNNFTMNLIQNKTPLLLDRTNTPRGVMKKITLERTFDKDIWLYNKKTCDEFASTVKDIKQGKTYKKRIMKRNRQRSKSAQSATR